MRVVESQSNQAGKGADAGRFRDVQAQRIPPVAARAWRHTGWRRIGTTDCPAPREWRTNSAFSGGASHRLTASITAQPNLQPQLPFTSSGVNSTPSCKSPRSSMNE